MGECEGKENVVLESMVFMKRFFFFLHFSMTNTFIKRSINHLAAKKFKLGWEPKEQLTHRRILDGSSFRGCKSSL